MLGAALFEGQSVGTSTVRQFPDGDAFLRGAVMSAHTRGECVFPREDTDFGARGEWGVSVRSSALAHSSAKGTASERASAHKVPVQPASTTRNASRMARGSTQRASAAADVRMNARALSMVLSPPPRSKQTTHGLLSESTGTTSSPVASAAYVSAGTNTAGSRVPRTSPSSLPERSIDSCVSCSTPLQAGAARMPEAESYWVSDDVYLALSAPLLHECTLQDRVATLCCPMAPSVDGQSKRVTIDGVLSFPRHGNTVAPPIATAAATVTSASTPQSPMQSSQSLHLSQRGSLSDKAHRVFFPLFCALGAKMCTVSRHTRSICSIHTPVAPATVQLAMHPDRRGGCDCGSHHSSDNRADSPCPAVQQGLMVEPGKVAEAVSPRCKGGRDCVLLLFAEQLISAFPHFPVELLYTTSPTGAVVAEPPAEAAAFWCSWQQTPRVVRRSVSYEDIWGVVTLPRLVTMMQRWGVGPAVAMRQLCVRLRCASTLLPEPTRSTRPLHTTVAITLPQGEKATMAAALPGTTDAPCRLRLPWAGSNSCSSASPPHMRTTAHEQLASVSAIAPVRQMAKSTSRGGASWYSSSSRTDVVLHRDKCRTAIGGTAAAVRAPMAMLKRSERATHGEFDATGVTTPRSQDELLRSSDQGGTGAPVHPYNGVGTPHSAKAAPDGGCVLYGQAYRYDITSPPPLPLPSAALTATESCSSVGFLRRHVPGTPLRESSAPFFSTHRLRYLHAAQRPLQLHLQASSFLPHTSDHVCAAKGEGRLLPPRCSGTTKRTTNELPDARYNHCGESAHPYEVPVPINVRRPGCRRRQRHSGIVRQHGCHCDYCRGTDVRDAPTKPAAAAARDVEQAGEVRRVSANQRVADHLADHGKAARRASASPLTPTPPAHDGSGRCLGPRQRTENVKRYIHALISASAQRCADPSPTAADGLSQQQLQRTPHRCDTSETLATSAEAPPSRVASSSCSTGSGRKNNLRHWCRSGDGDEALARWEAMSPPQLQHHEHQYQRYLNSSPHMSILLSQLSSISTHSSITSNAVPGDVSAALGGQAASISALHGSKQLRVGSAAGRNAADTVLSTLAGASAFPSMTASPESSLVSSASVASALPATHISPHPAADPFSNAANATAHDAARSEKDDSLSTWVTSSFLSSISAWTQVLLQLTPPPPSTQARRFPSLDPRPTGLPLSSCSSEDRDARPRASAPPEVSSPSLSLARPPLFTRVATEEVAAAAAAVELHCGLHHHTGITTFSPSSKVLSPPRPEPLAPRTSSRRAMPYATSAASADDFSQPLRHDCSSVVSRFAAASAPARSLRLLMSGWSDGEGSIPNARPLSASESVHSAERRGLTDQAISVDSQLRDSASEHTDDARAVAASGTDGHDSAAELTASTFVPPASPPRQPSVPPVHWNLRLDDAMVASAWGDGGEWSPSFLPLLRLALTITTQSLGDASVVRVAVSTLPDFKCGSLSQRARTAALLMNLVVCLMQAVGRGYVARRNLGGPSQQLSGSYAERTAASVSAAAASATVKHSPHPMLATSNPSPPSSATAPPSTRHHGSVTPPATRALRAEHFPASRGCSAAAVIVPSDGDSAAQPPQGCPPPSLNSSLVELTFPIATNTAKTSTTLRNVCAPAWGASPVATTTPELLLRRHNAVSQTSSASNRISPFSPLAAAATNVCSNNFAGTGLKRMRPHRSSDPDSERGSPASPLRLATSLKVQSRADDAASATFRSSTEEWTSARQQQPSCTPSCTVPFLDRAIASGPSTSTSEYNSRVSTSPDRGWSTLRQVSVSGDGGTLPVTAEALLQLQRIGRGYLIRRHCEEGFRARQERFLRLQKRVLAGTAMLSPHATPAEEDGAAGEFGVGGAGGSVTALLSAVAGLSSPFAYQAGDQTPCSTLLLHSTPSVSGACTPLVIRLPGQRYVSSVEGRKFPAVVFPASSVPQMGPNHSGPEGVAGICGDGARLADDPRTATTLAGKESATLLTPNSAQYVASPTFTSSKQSSGVLLTNPPSHVITSGSPRGPREVDADGSEEGTAAARGGGQEAGATQARHVGTTPSAPPPATVTVAKTGSSGDNTAFALSGLPTQTVALLNTATAPQVDTCESPMKAQPSTGSAPSLPRQSLQSLQSLTSLHVSFARDSASSSAHLTTLKGSASGAAALVAVFSASGTSAPVPMSVSGFRPSRSEGTYLIRSPHRRPPSPFAVSCPPHDDVTRTAVESSVTGGCPARRRRLLTAAAGAELSPTEGSIFTASGPSARSLNSIHSLPFSFSTTANTMSLTAPIFGTSLPDGLNPELWVLDGAELVAVPSSDSECSRSSDAGPGKEGSASSDCSSEGGIFKKELICIAEGGAGLAFFGAAAQALGHRAAPSTSKPVLFLQRIGRGYVSRRHAHFLLTVSISRTEMALMQRVALGFLTRRRLGVDYFVHYRAKYHLAYWELRNRSAVLVQSVVRGFNARQRATRLQRRVSTRIELRSALEQPDPDD